MQTTLGVDVLGVVQPGAVQAVAATRNGRVGLLATPATVASGAYERGDRGGRPVRRRRRRSPARTWRAIIEARLPVRRAASSTPCARYCAPLREAGVDTVILGCTHYPLVRPMLQRMLGRGVEIVTSGAPLARQVEHVLGARGLGNPRRRRGRLPLPVHRRRRGVPRARHPLPAAAARRGRARRRSAPRAGRGAR